MRHFAAAAFVLFAALSASGCVGFAEVSTFEMRAPPPERERAEAEPPAPEHVRRRAP